MRIGFPGFALAMTLGSVPVRSSDRVEPTLSPREHEVLDEYRLNCRPGRFVEDVRANLEKMQHAHPGSNFLKDTAFLAEVHYLYWGVLGNGNGKKPPGWVNSEMFDTIFNDYAPSRDAWRRSRMYGNKSSELAILGMVFGVVDLFFGLHSLFNEPPRGGGSLAVYRFEEIILPIGWISSFIYSGIYKAKENREFDNAFFESNGKAIAKRLAQDP